MAPHALLLAAALAASSAPKPLRHSADVDDTYALLTNPAGLAFLEGYELRLLFVRSPPETPKLGTIDGLSLLSGLEIASGFVIGGGLELEFAHGGEVASRPVLGLAFGGESLSFGFSWDRLSPLSGEAKGVLSAGLASHPFRWLALGLGIRDLAQNADRRTYDLGLALRPMGEALTLSAQWRLRQGTSVDADNLDMSFLAELEPVDGLFLAGGFDLEERISFRVGLDFEQLSLGVFGGGGGGTSAFAGAEVAYRSQRAPTVLKRRVVAVLDLEGELTPDPSFNLLARRFEVTPYGGVPLLLEQLQASEKVRGLFVRIGDLDIGWAKAVEVRRGLLAIREDGRRVDCQLGGYGDLEYFIATACTSVVMPPAAALDVNGLAANVLFFAEGLESIGVEVEVVRRGAYKSTPEQFTRTGMSKEQREALGAYLDAIFETMLDGIADGRKLQRAEVVSAVDRGTMTATEALAAKWVDAVLFPDEVEDYLNERHGGQVPYVPAASAVDARASSWGRAPRVAVVHVDAPITGGESTDLPFGLGAAAGAVTIVDALDRAKEDPEIRAVVLRVDSPGGEVLASDLIARAVRKLNETKPVIVSFGDTAASGGYYVAAPARAIFAEPTTLTGSIGVFSMKLSVEELLAKLGIGVGVVERGVLANAGSIFHAQTKAEHDLMVKGVGTAYEQFLAVVAEGRRKNKDEIRAIAEGRIWSGRDAKSRGLVDELGGLVDAIRRAKLEAGLTVDAPVELVTMPDNRTELSNAVRLALGPLVALLSGGAASPEVFPQELMKPLRELLAQGAVSHARPAAMAPFVVLVD